MKLNTITYQDGKPSFNQINAPTNSNYAIGIKVNDKDGEEIPLSAPDIKLVDGENVLSPSKIKNGYVIFLMESGNEPVDRKYDVKVNVAGKETEPKQVFILNKLKIGPNVMWSVGSQTNYVTSDLIGKTFDFNSFGNMMMRLNFQDKDGIDHYRDRTVKEWCEERGATEASFQFQIGSTNYAYVITDVGLPDVNNSLVKWDGQKYVPISSMKVDADITVLHYALNLMNVRPSIEEFGDLSPLSVRFSFKCPNVNIETPFTLTINELKSNVGELDGMVFDQTIRMSGTFVDGKEFSYDIPVK